MRILYAIQRYGEGVAGGAEQHCREFAERLARRGHEVEVVTSCAASYVDWANVFEPGLSTLNGVFIRRLPVAHARDGHLFARLNSRIVNRQRLVPMHLQQEWMRMQGPYVPQLPRWLRHNAGAYDCVIFITYLYWTTWAGIRATAGAFPTLLHPTAHDEPPIRLSLFNDVFRSPDAFAFLTAAEARLVAERFPGAPAGEVIGIGVDLDRVAKGRQFRRHAGIGNRPYIAYVGRVDPAKGAAELLDYFVAHKTYSPSDLMLVFVGQSVMSIPDREDVVVTGFVPDTLRDSAVAGSLALVQPSYFESFSMVLTEAFAQRRPALVQGRCAVLAEHAERSGAAIPYSGFAEFDAALSMVVDRPEFADELGARGRDYVERNYEWSVVLDRYEALIQRVSQSRSSSVSGREDVVDRADGAHTR
jgi:glycosyltransferase involved in cell wall biosynthesis